MFHIISLIDFWKYMLNLNTMLGQGRQNMFLNISQLDP